MKTNKVIEVIKCDICGSEKAFETIEFRSAENIAEEPFLTFEVCKECFEEYDVHRLFCDLMKAIKNEHGGENGA